MVRCTLAAFILEDRRKKRAQIKRSKKKERKLNDAMCAHLWVLYVIAEPCAQKNIVFGTPLEFITGDFTPEIFLLMSIKPKRKHSQVYKNSKHFKKQNPCSFAKILCKITCNYSKVKFFQVCNFFGKHHYVYLLRQVVETVGCSLVAYILA